MKLVTVKMPEIYVEGIDELIRLGRYSSRSEVIRTAIRDLLKKELWMIEEEITGRRKPSMPYKSHYGLVKRVSLISE